MDAIQESLLEKPGLPGLAFGILINGLWWRDSIYSGSLINQSSSLVTLTVFPGEPAMTLTFDKCDLNTLTPHLCSLNGTPKGMTRKESTLRPRTVYAKAQIKKGSRSAGGSPQGRCIALCEVESMAVMRGNITENHMVRDAK